ncbi:hypothetical protein [Clostridium saudiense]|uniref:hypothetical protein n=1 Tax=Clostridium saudiense TaxID=1414720 RepID=UPI0018AB4D4C|nr:hypothetical protein [Clostridium saudiense]
MIKAKDILTIKKEHEKYKKLLENETDILNRLKYGRIFREYEDKLMDIELQLLNIELGLFRDIELHKNIFIDRYIKNIPVERLVDKYRISRTKIYKVINKAKDLFESKRYSNSLIL